MATNPYTKPKPPPKLPPPKPYTNPYNTGGLGGPYSQPFGGGGPRLNQGPGAFDIGGVFDVERQRGYETDISSRRLEGATVVNPNIAARRMGAAGLGRPPGSNLDFSRYYDLLARFAGEQRRPSASLLYAQAAEPINARLRSMQENFQRSAARLGLSAGSVADYTSQLGLAGAGELGQAAVTAGVEGEIPGRGAAIANLLNFFRQQIIRQGKGKKPQKIPEDFFGLLG